MNFSDAWNSIDRLSGIVSVANWGIAITLLLGFVFTAVTIKAGGRRDELVGTRDQQERQKTAEAQEKAAKAQLELDKWLAKKIIARSAEPADFEPLKRFHDVTVDVLYKEGDGEAFMYAQSILQMLDGMRWNVPKVSVSIRKHPLAADRDNPIIGTFVIARHRFNGPEVFDQLALPLSERSLPFLLAGAVKGNLVVNPTLRDNQFVVVVGEYMRVWSPTD